MKGWADPQELVWKRSRQIEKKQAGVQLYKPCGPLIQSGSQRRWVFVQEVLLGSVSPTVLSGVMTRWGNSVRCLWSSLYFFGVLQEL